MSSLSLPTPSPSVPSLSLTTLSLPLTSSDPSPSPSPSPSSPFSSPTPTSAASSTPAPSSTTSSVPSSTPTPSTGPTTTLPTTSSTPTAPATVAQQSYSSATPTASDTAAGTSVLDPSSSIVVYTSATLSPSPTTTQSSSSGFFSNTGAVAGTFTVVSLVGVASVIAVALLILRRRHSRSYEEDMEYLDRTPDLSADPPMTQVTPPDDGFTSDHGHYGASPMDLTTPPAAYYPDHAYTLRPQAFPADPSGPGGYPSPYTQDYAAQHIYSPDDYNIAYPPSAPRVDPTMPNPHEFANAEPDSAPAPPAQSVLPDALRPSVKPTPSIPKQWSNTRFSVDSFYAGIVTDNHPSSGQAF